MKILYCLALSIVCTHVVCAQSYTLTQQRDRWKINPDGSIEWTISDRLPHNDHIEMSGEKVSLWMQYGVDSSGASSYVRTIVFPTHRLLPQRTVAHMTYEVTDRDLPRFFINDRLLKSGVFNAAVTTDQPEKVTSIRHKGIMEVESEIGKDRAIKLKRYFFPSVDKAMALEKIVFINNGKQPAKVEMEYLQRETSPGANRTKEGPHHFIISTVNHGEKNLQPGDSVVFGMVYRATRGDEKALAVDIDKEQAARKSRVGEILSLLQLETPDPVLNTMFAFSKIRATESIYNTKGGLMHGPGGLRYYAAIWANDQTEYVNPFFAFLGDETGNKSAMNAFRLFARYMNPEYKPIPSSVIDQGDGTWHGAKDRGDMAMIAYGAGRYALTFGNADSAKALWPLIEWCLEYLKRKVTDEGVVYSDSDELEGRFPAGKANLSTNVLAYGGLQGAARLAASLGDAQRATQLRQEAEAQRGAIESYFGARMAGYDTYRYYDGNEKLRAWIALPLALGITERQRGTVDALLSPQLWSENGVLTEAGDKTFWDRSTLYGLRGVFFAGATEESFAHLLPYTRRRLLGEHVPYPVEAYPENAQSHLSAESALYCRVFLEGLFGIVPTGFGGAFDLTPRLPAAWDAAEITLMIGGGPVHIAVRCGSSGVQQVRVTSGDTILLEQEARIGTTFKVPATGAIAG